MARDGASELDEGLELRARRPGQPGVEVRRREAGILKLVALLEQEGAVEGAVGLLDFCKDGELVD